MDWNNLFESLPFVLSAGQDPKLNTKRIMETVISAAIIGGVVYGTLTTDLQNVKTSLVDLKQDVRVVSQRMDSMIDSRKR